MGNHFDRLQNRVFDTAGKWFGVDASWVDGGETKTARVLCNKPTESVDVADSIFDESNNVIEYKEGDFPGLFEAVRSHERITVTINGVEYLARNVIRDFDGKTYKMRVSAITT